MSGDTTVTIYYGPLSWFKDQLGEKERTGLLDIVYERDEASRRHTHVVEGQGAPPSEEPAQFINGLLGGTLLRKQFSMFHNDKFASYLFGGKHSEASFARDLLDRESGVILIDEFDKANSVFHSAFYQLFDGGVFEDKNYIVELGPSLIICTSNYSTEDEIRKALGDALYSRFDSLVHFKPLSKNEIRQVIDRLVEGRYRKLDSEEQDWLDVDNIKAKLYAQAHKLGNVRKLGKLVDEVISLMLVCAVLSEVPKRMNNRTRREQHEQ